MTHNKFLQSTFILIIGGLITKILGFMIKIMYTRAIGPDGISLYALIMPTYSLMVTVANFGMPVAISKLVSENKICSQKILSQALYILLFTNILIMFLLILSSNFIATVLLKTPATGVLIIGASLSMPNMAIACILKGYYYGKQRMLPNTISNVIEQLIRIIFIIFFLPYFIKKSLLWGVLSFLLINIITEGASILTFLILLPKHTKISIKDLKYNHDLNQPLLSVSLPVISTKIIGNVGFFLEPIILSHHLSFHYSNSFFIKEYGLYNSYSLSLLLLPTFFIAAITTSLIPEISKFYTQKNIKMVKRRIKQALILSFVIGSLATIFITAFRYPLLKLIYNETSGAAYIKSLSFFFIFYYLEAPLSSALQALNKASTSFKISTFAIIIKEICLYFLSYLPLKLYSLVIAEALNIIIVVLISFKSLLKTIKKL